MRSFSTVSLFAAAAFVGSQISQVAAGSGQTVQVASSGNFCFFLPPPGSSDMNISDNEGDAVAYCMGSTPEAAGANKFPSGFILSAHFVSTSDYVQVTGQIDPSKANLNSNDEGGQYDVVSPAGATCSGYKYFVNLVEPAGNDYCIRCCNSETDCNRGISQDGCARVVPGDYSGPGASSSGSSSSSGGGSASSSSSASGATSTGSKSGSSGSSSGSSGSGSDGSSGSSSGSDGSSSSSSGSDGSSGSSGSDGSSADGSGSDSTGTDGSDTTATDAATSSDIPASSSPVAAIASSSASAPSSALPSVAASSAASGASSASLPTESVSAQSVNGAASTAPATVMVLALGGLAAAFMQLV